MYKTGLPGQPDGPGQRDRRHPRRHRRCILALLLQRLGGARRREPAGRGLRWHRPSRPRPATWRSEENQARRGGTGGKAASGATGRRRARLDLAADRDRADLLDRHHQLQDPVATTSSPTRSLPPAEPTLDNYRIVIENDFVAVLRQQRHRDRRRRRPGGRDLLHGGLRDRPRHRQSLPAVDQLALPDGPGRSRCRR